MQPVLGDPGNRTVVQVVYGGVGNARDGLDDEKLKLIVAIVRKRVRRQQIQPRTDRDVGAQLDAAANRVSPTLVIDALQGTGGVGRLTLYGGFNERQRIAYPATQAA